MYKQNKISISSTIAIILRNQIWFSQLALINKRTYLKLKTNYMIIAKEIWVIKTRETHLQSTLMKSLSRNERSRKDNLLTNVISSKKMFLSTRIIRSIPKKNYMITKLILIQQTQIFSKIQMNHRYKIKTLSV